MKTDTTTPPAVTNATKEQLLDLLCKWVSQRPGFDTYNYTPQSYRSDCRRVTRQRNDFYVMLREVKSLPEITADSIRAASRSAFSGRLSFTADGKGKLTIEYCTGQYWCTEYRAAACAVLACCLWDVQRTALYAENPNNVGDRLRKRFKNWFGPGIQTRWFD